MRVGKNPIWGYGFILGAAVLAGICFAIIESVTGCNRQDEKVESAAL